MAYILIGLLLGPRGESLQQLEKSTGATIAIRGKGTRRDGSQSNRGHPDDGDDLHVALAGSEDAVRLAYMVIRRVIDTAKLISDSRSDWPCQPEKANLATTDPKGSVGTQNNSSILDEVAGPAIVSCGSTVANQVSLSTDPRLRGRGSHSQVAPVNNSSANQVSNMQAMNSFLSSLPGYVAEKSPPATATAKCVTVTATTSAIASRNITDKINVLGADAGATKADVSTAQQSNYKCSDRPNELVRAIQKHLPSHRTSDEGNRGMQQQPVTPLTLVESSKSSIRTIR